MSVKIYLGNPSAKIVEWIRRHMQPAGHADTWYKYENDTEWRTVSIKGTIAFVDDTETPTGQVENPYDIVAIEIGTDVTSIGYCAFYNCNGLTSVTIGNGVTSIGDFAFYGCSGLKSVTISSGVTSIGEWAFYYCNELTNVSIPNSVTNIRDYAFNECFNLSSVTIPDSVTNIGENAFSSCYGLTSVTIQGKTMSQVEEMENYPWGIEDPSIIIAEGDSSNSN